MRKCFFLLFFLIDILKVQAQPALPDSIRLFLQNSPDDTAKVKRFFFATRYLPFNQPDSGLYYADSIIRLAGKIDYDYGKADAYEQKADAYAYSGDYSKAVLYAHQSLRSHEALDESSGVSHALETLSYIYNELGDYRKALEYQLKSREILFSLGDSAYMRFDDQILPTADYIAGNDKGIAEIYLEMGMTDSALKYGKSAFLFYQNRCRSFRC